MKRLHVYLYSCLDTREMRPHTGLTTAASEIEVRANVLHNYYEPRYITVRRVPELVATRCGEDISISRVAVRARKQVAYGR